MNFAIIGAGAIAELRKNAIEKAAGASFVGVYDIDESKANAFAGDGIVFDSLDSAVSASSVDAVIVSTPPNFHEDAVVLAAKAGKHVIVEKPMANSVDACHRMMETAKENNVALTVGFNHRYFPAIKDIKHAVDSGAIGQLSYVRAFAGHTGLSEFKSPWMYDKDVMGGGALFDNGIHMIDLVQHLMGPVRQVSGRTLNKIWALGDVEDNGFALVENDASVVGALHASWTEWKGYHFFIEAYGDKGMARAYYAPMRSTVITMEKPGGAPKRKTNYYPSLIVEEKLRGWQSTAIKTLTEEISDFICLASGDYPNGPIAGASDGLRAIELANAIYASNHSRQTVTLADIE